MAKQASCQTCIYAQWDRGLWLRTFWSGFPAGPSCGKQPDSAGRLKECPAGGVCRNYRRRPPTPKGEHVKMIPLTQGFYTYVDAADYEWLNQWHWLAFNGYAIRREKGKTIFMHRQIMQTPKGKVVDHINGNRFDNTRANMRNVTQQQNICNSGKHSRTTSIYKGVSYSQQYGKWRAAINFEKEAFHLGYFASEIEAARAYDRKAVELLNGLARLNLPEEWPARRRARVYRQGQAAGKREGKKQRKGRGKGKKVISDR